VSAHATTRQEVSLHRVTAARIAQKRADDEYRAAVLAAVEALEWKRGSIDRIAAAAGVTRQAIRKMLYPTK
jgi:AcrR family transcriptional regulator